MARKRGIAAETARAMAATRAAVAEDAAAAQPALLPEVTAGGEGSRGRGRPAGATNARTRDFARYIEAAGLRLPGVHLARTYSLPIEEMLKELRLEDTEENRRWAIERQDEAARALLPYLHERQPIAMQISGVKPIAIVMGVELGDGSGETVAADDLEGTVLTLLEGEVGNEHDQ